MRGSHSHSHHDCRQQFNSWGRNWDPRCKAAAAVIFIFLVVSLDNPWMVLAAFLFVTTGALLMGLKMTFLFSRLLVLAPFIALMSVPLIFGGGFPLSEERVAFAALISLKALTSMSTIIVLLSTQPLEEFLESLSSSRLIPPLIISLLFLSCRYALLFIEELHKTSRALSSRLFSGGIKMEDLKVYGNISAGIFIKSLERSEMVSRSMASRGFSGRLPPGDTKKISAGDYLKSTAAVGFALALIAVEWMVL